MGWESRLHRAEGSAWEVGLSLGRAVGPRLADNIARYVERGPGSVPGFDWARLHEGALDWLSRQPERFQGEFRGLAAGAGIPLESVCEWCFAEECAEGGCTAVLYRHGGRAWVARNNDIWVPELWGYATQRAVQGRLPTLNFGMEAEPFTPSGVNRERLWLHYNFLPVWAGPPTDRTARPPYIWMTDALERCRSLADVERLLDAEPRTGGMMLFAIEGATESAAIYECGCLAWKKRELGDTPLAGTNHYCAAPTPAPAASYAPSSLARLARVEALLDEIQPDDTVGGLRRLLADPQVEGRDADAGTVYACVACPGTGELWYTFGGYPAASAGDWQRVPWPWG